jgi:hypothetical protein
MARPSQCSRLGDLYRPEEATVPVQTTTILDQVVPAVTTATQDVTTERTDRIVKATEHQYDEIKS